MVIFAFFLNNVYILSMHKSGARYRKKISKKRPKLKEEYMACFTTNQNKTLSLSYKNTVLKYKLNK